MKLIRRFKESLLHQAVGLDLRTFRELEVDAVKNAHYCRGFYVHYNGKRLGIVATDEGPVFLCDEEKFLLGEQHSFRFYLQRNEEINTFIFMWEGTVKLQIPYLRSLISCDGNWVDDSIFDFFSWLHEAAAKKRFYSYYTVKEISTAELHPAQPLQRTEKRLSTV